MGVIRQTIPSLVISTVIRHIIGIAIIGMPIPGIGIMPPMGIIPGIPPIGIIPGIPPIGIIPGMPPPIGIGIGTIIGIIVGMAPG
jgi:hypothetical protein